MQPRGSFFAAHIESHMQHTEHSHAKHSQQSISCAGARTRPQERFLAAAMATHPRLGADSLLGRLFPDELFRNLLRAAARRLRAQ